MAFWPCEILLFATLNIRRGSELQLTNRSIPMVKMDYLLFKPSPPTRLRRLVTQQLFPSLIDAAGGVERILDTVSEQTERRPLPFVVAAGLCGIVLAAIGRRSVDT